MKVQFNNPSKGNNFCNKFISTQYARNAIYNAVSTDLTPMQQQQQKIAGAFEYTVAGVAKALEESNTGWSVDASFKEGENIVSQITLPSISAKTVEKEIETWSDENNSIFSTRNYGTLLINDNFSNGTRLCSCRTSQGTSSSPALLTLIILNKNPTSNYLTITEQRSFKVPNEFGGQSNESLETVAGGFYFDQSGQDYIMVLVKGRLNNGTPKLFLCNYQIGSSSSLLDLTDITPTNILDDTSDYPIVSARFSDVTSSIHTFIAKTDQKIWYADIQNSLPSFTSTSIYHWNQCNNWFAVATKNEEIYLAVLEFQNGLKRFQVYRQEGNAWNNYWSDISPYYLSNFSGLYFDFSQNSNYLVLLAQDDSNCEIFLHGVLGSFKIALSNINSCCLSKDYLYLATNDNATYSCYQYDLQTKSLSEYIQTFTTPSLFGNLFYFDCFYFVCSNYCVQIHNRTTIEVLDETEQNVTLSAFVNLTHKSGKRLQISCAYHSKALNLYDNNNNTLYGNDIGLSFDISSNQMLNLQQNRFGICNQSNSGNTSGLLKEEVVSNVQLGQIEYYVLSNTDGNFISLIVKDNHGVIANIGCGDLISELQYPEYDIAENAHTMYYSLGFIDNSLSTVPRGNNLKNNLTVAFVAPTYQGFRFYGGKNNDSNKDLLYYAKGAEYIYQQTALNTDDCAYTMPILLGIEGADKTYYFNEISSVKGLINRQYLVVVSNIDSSLTMNGKLLDNGNYLYLGKQLAIGWDKSNSKDVNPYYEEE